MYFVTKKVEKISFIQFSFVKQYPRFPFRALSFKQYIITYATETTCVIEVVQ